MPRKVILEFYTSAWVSRFEAEAEKVRSILMDEVVAIYHIGSTSIPGIYAKPIIDLLVEVKNIELLDSYNPQMDDAGYHPKGEYGIPGRRYFSSGMENLDMVHVHAFQSGHPDIERHLSFCAYLRSHPKDAQAYSDLKRKLALQFPEDTESYTDAKGPFIRRIESKAKSWWEAGGR